MSEPITFELPGIVRGKGRPRFAMRGGKPATFTPDATRSYEAEIKHMAVLAMRGRLPIDGPVRVSFRAVFEIPASWPKRRRALAEAGLAYPTKKPDGDNILKLCDALNAVVWRDDAQVVDARVEKVFGPVPKLIVHVEEIGLGMLRAQGEAA